MLTVYSMVIAIILGITLAVMRLSDEPRRRRRRLAVPLGVPRNPCVRAVGVLGPHRHDLLHASTSASRSPRRGSSFETKAVVDVFWFAVIGLSLNEAAYMAEIVRAGILSVDRGQDEAATALGMSWMQTMRRVIIPQAMRIIIPPTGNEVISMLKTTSLVTAVPYSFDLYGRARDISVEIFDPIPLLLVASAWYLLFTSILMIGQYFLEKRFSRGVGQARPEKKATTGNRRRSPQ